MLALVMIVDDLVSTIWVFKGNMELVDCRDIDDDVEDTGLV